MGALGAQLVKNRQCKRCGLACACLCLADHILACQHYRNHGRLDRRRRGKAKQLYGLHQLWVQIQLGKCGCHLKLLMSVLMTPLCRETLAGLAPVVPSTPSAKKSARSPAVTMHPPRVGRTFGIIKTNQYSFLPPVDGISQAE
jgi:hypothetical protein